MLKEKYLNKVICLTSYKQPLNNTFKPIRKSHSVIRDSQKLWTTLDLPFCFLYYQSIILSFQIFCTRTRVSLFSVNTSLRTFFFRLPCPFFFLRMFFITSADCHILISYSWYLHLLSKSPVLPIFTCSFNTLINIHANL